MDAEDDLLGDHSPDRTWEPFYRQLKARYRIHMKSAQKRNKRYKLPAQFFRVILPIGALALTISVTTDYTNEHQVSVIVAIALTVFTSVDAVIQRSRRFLEYAKRAIELEEWGFNLEDEIDELVANSKPPDDQHVIRTYLLDKNEELSKIGSRLALNLVT